MSRRRFRPWSWRFRPVSLQGWVLVVLAAVFCTPTFLAVDRHSHSVSDTRDGVFPYVAPCLMLLNWVAGKTSDGAD